MAPVSRMVTLCLSDNALVIHTHYSNGCWYKDLLTLIERREKGGWLGDSALSLHLLLTASHCSDQLLPSQLSAPEIRWQKKIRKVVARTFRAGNRCTAASPQLITAAPTAGAEERRGEETQCCSLDNRWTSLQMWLWRTCCPCIMQNCPAVLRWQQGSTSPHHHSVH